LPLAESQEIKNAAIITRPCQKDILFEIKNPHKLKGITMSTRGQKNKKYRDVKLV
jgi:hypothetical protein